MNDLIFSFAEDKASGRIVHVDDVPQGLACKCVCPNCKESLMARKGAVRAHGFAHHSRERRANLEICYEVIMYKLAEQIIKDKKRINAPSYYGIFKKQTIYFKEVAIDCRYERQDKQPDVIATTEDGRTFIIEFTFSMKAKHIKVIDYKNINILEINLWSQINESLDKLESFLLDSEDNRRWINHPEFFDGIERKYEDNGKSVKIKNKKEQCENCLLYTTNCCGIRFKNETDPIEISNNDTLYRVCKTEEFDHRIKKLKNSNGNMQGTARKLSSVAMPACATNRYQGYGNQQNRQNVYDTNSRNAFSENEYMTQNGHMVDYGERRANSLNNQQPVYTGSQSKTRSCLDCMKNRDFESKEDGKPHCGMFRILNVPETTPPETAQNCEYFSYKY